MNTPHGIITAEPAAVLFRSGEHGYHTFRIPALIVSPNGTLLAFCEGRKASSSDAGEIDLLVRRSTTNGASWSDPAIVWTNPGNTCGNPSPVIDPQTGDIVLLGTWNLGTDKESAIIAGTSKDTRRIFVLRSTDDGLSWSHPGEITTAVKPNAWSWYATGPGAGIVMQYGSHAGRIIIPCDHVEKDAFYSHTIHSDDGGHTWKLGGSAGPGANECQLIELEGGRLLLNMRNHAHTETHRKIAFSDDGGATWMNFHSDPVLLEPVCQAAIRRARWTTAERPGVIFFSNPACVHHPTDGGRRNLVLRASFDDARTWPVACVLHPGYAAYSDLAILPDETVCCLYEAGENHVRESIRIARAHLELF